jgi:hypothetical protein
MSEKCYLLGEWSVSENRGSTLSLGYFKDGIGFSLSPSERAFSIQGESLFAPDGTELGKLTELGESWAVDLGNFNTGHILRQVR